MSMWWNVKEQGNSMIYINEYKKKTTYLWAEDILKEVAQCELITVMRVHLIWFWVARSSVLLGYCRIRYVFIG